MNNLTPILAIETSQTCCGACVYFDTNKYFETSVNFKNVHAEKIFEVITSTLRIARIKIEDLKCIAISSGPGSFTGLRIGMSAIKGLAFGLSIPIITVPTFEALAYQLSRVLPNDTEFIIANKVNSDEIYYAKFKVTTNSYIFVRDLQIIGKNDESFVKDKCLIYGNAVSDSTLSTKKEIASSPTPVILAQWAVDFGKEKIISQIDFVEPVYLKNFIVKDKII